MIPATLTITLLLFAVILAAAGAPLYVLYIVGGLASFWQLMVSLAAGVGAPLPPEPDVEYTEHG